MAQISTCLKCVFIIFNIFLAVLGGIIIGLALLAQFSTSIQGGENLVGRTTGLFVLYIVGGVTIMIAILGAYGANRESNGCLMAFLVCMALGCLVMLIYAIPLAVVRPRLEGVMEQQLRWYLPLDYSPADIQKMANNLQKNFHCCGLFSHSDWRNIPNSCLCSEQEEEEGECQAVGYSVSRLQKSIYSKTCFPIMRYYALLAVDIMIGVFFTVAVVAFFGMILSSIMIYQMHRPNRATILLTVPTIFSPKPPRYEELDNPPPYSRGGETAPLDSAGEVQETC